MYFFLQAVNLLNEYDYIIIQEIIEEFTENGVTDIEMSFDVEQNVLQQSIIDAIPQDFITQFDYITVSVTGFQPSSELFLQLCFTIVMHIIVST